MNDQPANQPYLFPVLRTAAWLIGVCVLIAAVMAGVLSQLGVQQQMNLNFLAAGVCLAAGLLALLPVYLLSRKAFSAAAYGFLVGILIRMAVCGLFIVVTNNMELDPTGKLPFWVAGWYLVTLFIEVTLMSRYIRTFTRSVAGESAQLLSVGADAENAI